VICSPALTASSRAARWVLASKAPTLRMPFLINQLQTSLTLAAITAGSLADHKQQLAKAIDANGASFSTNLSSERSAMLRNSIPWTLRVLKGPPTPVRAMPCPVP